MHQTMKPNEIILYLDKTEFKDSTIPLRLKAMQKRGLQIVYDEPINSYLKVLPALKKYRSDIVVMAEGNVIYSADWLERLYKGYKSSPNDIICCDASEMTLKEDGTLKPYNEWQIISGELTYSSDCLLPIGSGGAAFPPNAFNIDDLNDDNFIKIAPTWPLLWLWALSKKNGCGVTKIPHIHYQLIDDKELSEKEIKEKHNEEQFQIDRVLKRFDILNRIDTRSLITGERIYPDQCFISASGYVLYLKHKFAYELAARQTDNSQTVLELGCGEGYGSYLLSKTAQKVVAVDIDKNTIDKAVIKYGSDNLSFYQYDGIDLSFLHETFDLIVSFQVIEHVINVEDYLNNIKSLLKPGGKFMITTPNRRYRLAKDQAPWNKFHLREYSEEMLREDVARVFSDGIIYSINASSLVKNIEYARVRNHKADYDGSVDAVFIPNNFMDYFSTDDFYVSRNDVGDGLDLLVTNIDIR